MRKASTGTMGRSIKTRPPRKMCIRDRLPFDGTSDLVSMLGAVLEAELGERAACAGWFNDATNLSLIHI